MAKVVRGGNIFFKDDIKIIDAEVDSSLNLPPVPIFSRDELQIFYNGHVFVTSRTPENDKQIKVYTMVLGLQEIDSPKIREDEYFSDNSSTIDKLKEDFIERVVNGISILDDKIPLRKTLKTQVGSELVNRIEKQYKKLGKPDAQNYAGKGLITELEDDSVFNSDMKGCERTLLLDGKIYVLETISEYIAKFQKSLEPSFYKNLQKACESSTPEEISKMWLNNKDKIHRKVLPMVRNKIWHSNRSFKLFLDGTYWIPGFKGKADDSAKLYEKLLEKKVKIDAVKKYLK